MLKLWLMSITALVISRNCKIPDLFGQLFWLALLTPAKCSSCGHFQTYYSIHIYSWELSHFETLSDLHYMALKSGWHNCVLWWNSEVICIKPPLQRAFVSVIIAPLHFTQEGTWIQIFSKNHTARRWQGWVSDFALVKETLTISGTASPPSTGPCECDVAGVTLWSLL